MQTLDLTESITETISNNLLTTAGTRLIQSTLPPNVQQRIASRLNPPVKQFSAATANPNPNPNDESSLDFDLPPLDFEVPVNFSQAKLLVQHKFIRPSHLAFRRLVFDLGAWVTSDATQQSALGTIVFTVIAIILFILAAITYAIFYAAYMPTVVTRVPAYLTFQDSLGLHTNGLQYPEAIVEFTQNILPKDVLRPDQHYTVGIDLYVPDAPSNYNPGNFMVSLNLTSSATGKKHPQRGGVSSSEFVLASARRPALVAYKSFLLRTLQTAARAVFLVPGWENEGQVVKVLMVDDYIEREDLPLQRAMIRIHTTDIQIFSCNIYLSAHFQGLRYFMHNWFYTTAALFIIFFMFWYALFGLLLWRMFVSWFENKAAQRRMRKVTRRRINADTGVEEEYESEEEVFSGDEDVPDSEMRTRVRVDLGKILKTTSTSAAESLSASAAAAVAAASPIGGGEEPLRLRKRQVFKMDALEEETGGADGFTRRSENKIGGSSGIIGDADDNAAAGEAVLGVSTQVGVFENVAKEQDEESPSKRSSSLPKQTRL
ncbi:Berardinelli-Seip congenital lipodystrophy 2 (seipin) [Physocladia obscura]|uniref:Berardinelli-Seip congenital lipodystrophy 2 (Seipin) n=1 Tax=Physocladia obscura TaxID=109957 RepID=A0AAD5T6L9_9FUNG|nr:Berardinelli-Seip congenital lipodystrophy 2 (seipin) [Physocladia obscura]